jgi:ArsR family metal-binding transcriptional regulator
MLINAYRLEVGTSTHSTEHFEYEAIAHLTVDLSPVLPYLNAKLSRGVYLPRRPVLSWRCEGHNIGFWPDRIAVDHLQSRQEVDEWADRLVALVNEVWEGREAIGPDDTTHDRLQPLELYRLLPGTNCKACGETTCFGFALKLAAGQTEPAACVPLTQEQAYADQRARLEAMISTKWPVL